MRFSVRIIFSTQIAALISLLALNGYAQGEASVWIFDNNLGIDFNDGRFRPFSTSVSLAQEGASASICDPTTGSLLFFTNGRTVWDRTYRPMPNGTGLNGGVNTHQAVLIVPVPKSDSRYFLFTTKSMWDTNAGGRQGLYYSIVDLDLNGGLGDVLEDQKNTLLLHLASEKLIAVPHANGEDFWLITHTGNADGFIVFPLTAMAVGPPATFTFGPTYGPFESQGWLQASPNGEMLVCAVSSDGTTENPLELYDFDAATGTISNRRELGLYPGLLGAAFSPDNTKLYFTFSRQLHGNAQGGMCQLNLGSGSIEEIVQSRTDLFALHNPLPDAGGVKYDTIRDGVLQLAPDGRIYIKAIAPYGVSHDGTFVTRYKIYFINNPNLSGTLCNPMGRDFPIKAFQSPNAWAFPNFMPHYFNGLTPVDQKKGDDCTANNVVSTYPNPTSGLVSVFFNSDCALPSTVELYDSIGQLIERYGISEPAYVIDLTDLASSVYLLRIRSSKHEWTVRVIKQ